MLGAATACVALALGVWGVRTPEVAALGPPQQPAAFLGAPAAAAAAAWPMQHSLRCSRQQQQQQQQQQQLAAARKPFVGGNWKCNGDPKGAEAILQMLNDAPPEDDDIEARVVVAPPALHAGLLLRGLRRPFAVALQDSSQVKSYGAFTGEIAPQMAKDFGIKTVIVGHSERRAGFGNQPAYASALGASGWPSVVIAYEPIWAIGTGQTASPQTAQQTHREIREWLRQHVGEEVAQQTRIIYGGSVKGSNAMASQSTHSAS
ncbi:triosephosphate isomerase, putative [Eimeria necatrix]|uniref:Triosephosphate isomerase n=1 Tax=Eimeria necatrix TaxID=51315 RepID=U6MP16_9EIME|nr:triosephosphate isomerase, putative [Eimeria necatrix]CDJ65756.1 triosephosphate isomerase, putative [Eimeria necatrix]